MKIELTNEQTGKLVDIWRRTGGLRESLEAVLTAYEEMRPKDAAPVMWRRGRHPDKLLYSDGKTIADIMFSGCTHHLTNDDLLSLPFPADPTPEEKAEAEFEKWAKSKHYDLTKDDGRYVDHATYATYTGFMAAKFPAGKEGAK